MLFEVLLIPARDEERSPPQEVDPAHFHPDVFVSERAIATAGFANEVEAR